MTLRELQDRINTIAAQTPQALDRPVTFHLQRGRNSWFIPVEHVSGCTVQIGNVLHACEIVGIEAAATKQGKRR